MTKIKLQQVGFSVVESVLIVVIVAMIGFVGWYVFNAQKKTNTVLNTVTTPTNTSSQAATTSKSATTSNSPGASDNAALEANLNSITSSSAQSNQDLNSATIAINDKSTFTSVPQ